MALTLCGREALAADSSPLDDYRAPASCPARDEFSAQVAARTPVFLAAPQRFHVAVEIVDAEARFVGRVQLTGEGHESVREIKAERCEELVQALSLIVAILIDPNADTRPMPVAAPPRAPPLPVEPWREPPPEPPPERPLPPLRVHAGTGLSVDSALLSSLALGPRVFAELGFPRQGAVPSSLRLSLGREWTSRVDAGGGASVTASLAAGRFEACWVRLSGGAFDLAPCTDVEIGALHVEGTHPVRNADHTLFWAALAAQARATYSYLRVAFLEAEVGATVPLSRYSFQFEGQPPLYVTSVVGLRLGLGLGVRFP